MPISLPKIPTQKTAKVLGVLVLVTGLTLAGTMPLLAQDLPDITTIEEGKSSLTAIPDRLGDDGSIKIKPGEKKQVEMRIVNSSTTSMTIATTAVDFIVGEDGAIPQPIDGSTDQSNRWSLASWLVATPTEQTLGPRRTGIVNVLIEVPQNALPGGHYAMVLHQPTLSPNNQDEQAVAAINQRVGTLLYVVVEGPINEEAYVADFTMPKFSEYGPVPFSYTVDNRSDIHITPKTGITIRNMFGKTVEKMEVETKNVFPLTNRKFEGEWKRIWGFGPYTAELNMSFGTQGKVVIAYSRFWLLPIKLVIAIVIVILTLVAAGISIRRHLLHRRQDQSKKIAELEQKLQSLEKEKLKQFEE
jgi:hypothetical protein